METLFFQSETVSFWTWLVLGLLISLSILAFVYFELIFGGSLENKIMKVGGWVLLFGSVSLFLLLDLISKGPFSEVRDSSHACCSVFTD